MSTKEENTEFVLKYWETNTLVVSQPNPIRATVSYINNTFYELFPNIHDKADQDSIKCDITKNKYWYTIKINNAVIQCINTEYSVSFNVSVDANGKILSVKQIPYANCIYKPHRVQNMLIYRGVA